MALKHVLITGCSEGGIGSATALAFQKLGTYHVFLDVTSAASISAAAQNVAEKTGGELDVLHNNVGQLVMAPALGTGLDEARRVFETNFWGVMGVFPHGHCDQRRGGYDGEYYGRYQQPFQSSYAASKASIMTYSETLRLELAPFGARVLTMPTGVVGSNLGSGFAEAVSLPTDSLYKPVEGALKERVKGGAYAKMDTDAYAEKFVMLAEGGKSGKIYLGNSAGVVKWARMVLPAGIVKDAAFGHRVQCMPPPELPNKWPLGIDRICELWTSNAEGRLLSFLYSIAKDYEPRNMLSQYLLLGPRAFHVLEPRNLEAILSSNFIDYGLGVRGEIFAPLLGRGIFTQEGAAWKRSRELLRKQFVRAQYQNLSHFEEHVDNLLSHLPDHGVVDLQPLFFSLTLDTATALLMGKSVYSLRADIDQDAENREFSESFNLAQDGLAKRFRIAPWHALYNPPAFRRACKTVHAYVDRYIEKRDLFHKKNRSDGEAYSFIDQIAQESNGTTELRDQLVNILLAGRDSTACCLSWTLRLLVRHPQTMGRLRSEITAVVGDCEHPTREQIRKMPFLSCIIKESLRLYPPVPLNNRQAIQTTILPTGGGPEGKHPILVRKGELVVFSQYVSSRMESIYGPDADEFRPERWEGDELPKIGWAYYPFGGGPRQCLGEDFARTEVSYTIVRLLQACSSFELPDGEVNERIGQEKQRLTLVLSSVDGCRVKYVRR
ncbi:hypothetical protein AYL99_06353 [Fonsecaea erecta]|uniref:Cytochrome P450 n=1 Tax=Fonsecaea erecta TaxID=1367422 RepID=A0A178ZJ36_9EURO|nr:hypothetical protein AYL99_06353 [Fonsecaea erecta]OAP59055.1 hypothetical protein AYL99_06353 [Fonsecaea erecta]